MPQLPQETRDRIVDLFRAGVKNKTELARRTGTSKPTVYKVLEEEGLYEPPGDEGEGEAEPTEGEEVSEELADRVWDLHEEGRMEEQIAEELGLELGTVEEILAEPEPEEPEDEEPEAPPPPPTVLAGIAGGFILGFALCYVMLRGFPNLPPTAPPGP